jgi:hypothetical protein
MSDEREIRLGDDDPHDSHEWIAVSNRDTASSPYGLIRCSACGCDIEGNQALEPCDDAPPTAVPISQHSKESHT